MQDVEEPCLYPSIHNLPHEILRAIFLLLDTKSLFVCHKVCHQWRCSVDDVGVDLHLGNPDQRIWLNYKGSPFLQFAHILEYGTRRCFISQLETKGINQPMDDSLRWRKPSTVRYLWIDGYIRPSMFNHLTKDLINLNRLEIHFSTLSCLSSVDFNLGSFPCLKGFSIRMFEVSPFRYKSVGRGLTNAIILLESPLVQFPSLTYVLISLPFEYSYIRAVSRGICRFVQRHASTLKTLELSFAQFVDSSKPYEGAEHGPEFTVHDFASLNLNVVNLHCLAEANPEMEVFNTMISNQHNLITFHSMLKHLSPAELRLVTTSCQNLTTIQVTINPVEKNAIFNRRLHPFNLADFGCCVNLTTLELVGPTRLIGDMNDADDFPTDVIGGVALPNGLCILTLISLFVSTEEAVHLISRPNLNEFCLINAGTTRNLGLPFHIFFSHIFTEHKINSVTIKNSINTPSITLANHSSDSALNLASLLTQRASINMFQVHLDKDRKCYVPGEVEDTSANYPDGKEQKFIIGPYEFFAEIEDVEAESSDDDEDMIIEIFALGRGRMGGDDEDDGLEIEDNDYFPNVNQHLPNNYFHLEDESENDADGSDSD